MKKILLTLVSSVFAISLFAQGAYFVQPGDVITGGMQIRSVPGIILTYANIDDWQPGNGGVANHSDPDFIAQSTPSSTSGTFKNNTIGGSYVQFDALADGVVKVGMIVNNNKTIHITEDSVELMPADWVTYDLPNKETGEPQVINEQNRIDVKSYGTITFAVKAGSMYRVSLQGSKMGFYGFKFDSEGAKREWDFTEWSSETLTALSEASTEDGLGEWRTFEKMKDGEITNEGGYYKVQPQLGLAPLKAAGKVIEETKMLKFALHMYEEEQTETTSGPSIGLMNELWATSEDWEYEGPSFVWMQKAGDSILVQTAMPNDTLTITAESHRPGTNRGFTLVVDGNQIGEPFLPDGRASYSWVLPAKADSVLLVVTGGGCHIVSMKLTEGEGTPEPDPVYNEEPNPATNLIDEGSYNFNNGSLNNWIGWNNGENKSSRAVSQPGYDNSAYCMMLYNPSVGNPWDSQCAYDIVLENGATYKFSFFARASEVGTIGVSYQDTSDYSGGGDTELIVTEDWERFSALWTIEREGFNRLIINFGNYVGTLYLDRMLLEKVESLKGDADDDGAVTVADITTIAAFILGNNPEKFNFTNADVDGDGAITVADITGTAGIILGK